ncbi:MAG: hypothetical protein HZB56_18100 [Deltaproteobacteria bacterium]|nr:hypothetical protein [Deltaproteobacteria bacterium]
MAHLSRSGALAGALLAAVALLGASPAAASSPVPSRCEALTARLAGELTDVVCFESTDLTTQNDATTPADNSLPGLPAFAFTPRTDRGVIAPSAAKRPPIARAVPGVQLQARFAGDPTGQGRFLLRLPDGWNGRLVVAGASGTRSEFNGDFAWSDFVLQQGYAYASQNKGVLNLRLVGVSATPPAADPLACRLNPASPVWVHFYDNDADQPFTRWAETMAHAAAVARRGAGVHYGRSPRHTYAVGTSNGGYQVRRAVESYPHLFDGGVDWEGTYVDAGVPNLLSDLPPAVLNYPDYVASGHDPASTAARNIAAAGYPPDLTATSPSLWDRYSGSFWEVTACQWQKRLDPGYDTYGSGVGGYNYVARLSTSDVAAGLSAFATTGRIRRPLITLAGTMDGLLPIDRHARAYARKVRAWSEEQERGRGRGRGREDDGDGRPVPYRLYEVQNAGHIETYADVHPEIELLMPHAQRAFELLVQSVEHGAALPPDQCVPRGGAISSAPAQPGHCARLLEP